jgi:hypothetical protein
MKSIGTTLLVLGVLLVIPGSASANGWEKCGKVATYNQGVPSITKIKKKGDVTCQVARHVGTIGYSSGCESEDIYTTYQGRVWRCINHNLDHLKSGRARIRSYEKILTP